MRALISDWKMKYTISKDDLKFKLQVESCKFPVSDFNHQAHLRLAYVYLSQHSADISVRLMRETLVRFLHYNGVDPAKYHETLTKAWILAVHHFMQAAKNLSSADEFIDANKQMLNRDIMLTHYSSDYLYSDEAKATFVQPNLDPIPRYSL